MDVLIFLIKGLIALAILAAALILIVIAKAAYKYIIMEKEAELRRWENKK